MKIASLYQLLLQNTIHLFFPVKIFSTVGQLLDMETYLYSSGEI
jgi:hypothetical protein